MESIEKMMYDKKGNAICRPIKPKEKINLDSHRCQYHRERIEALLNGERVAPITIDMALSKACNYACVFGFCKLQRNDQRYLNKKTLFYFLDDAAEIGVKAISLVSDGESSMNPNIYDFIQHGKDNNIDMALGTNGSLLRDDQLENMLANLSYLRFNVSGISKYQEIHGCGSECFGKVIHTIKKCVRIKKANNLKCDLGLQMVLLPQYIDQVKELAEVAIFLGVDYLVIKHCSDNEKGDLGIDYSQYEALTDELKKAESMSTEATRIVIKWSKIRTGASRTYSKCHACPVMLQISGNGLVAPCGSFFDKEHSKYHIGNIADTRFKDIFHSDRYWQVMESLRSDSFDAKTMCASLCLQDKCNLFINSIIDGSVAWQDNLPEIQGGVNFI